MRGARGQLAQQRQVEHVALDEAQVLVLGEVGAGQRVAVQVVEDDDLVLRHEPPRERGADEARAARHEDLLPAQSHDAASLSACDSATTEGVIAQPALAARQALGHLRDGRRRLAADRRLPAAGRHALPDARRLGAVDTLIALTVVLVIVFRAWASRWRSSASTSTPRTTPAGRRSCARRSGSRWRWRRSGSSLGSIFAAQISQLLFSTDSHANLVRAAFVLLWAQMNYEQLTSLFRVEERSVSYVAATLANVLITVGSTILLVAVWHKGAIGVLVGNFTGHARRLLRAARLPALPARARVRPRRSSGRCSASACRSCRRASRSGRSTSPTASSCCKLKGSPRSGVYSVGVRDLDGDPAPADRAAHRLAGVRLLDQERRRGQAHVRVRAHLRALPLLLALARALAARAVARARCWRRRAFYAGRGVVPLLVFGGTAFIAFNVMSIGIGRAKKTQFNWVVTGVAALRQHRAQPRADPALRDDRRRDRDARRLRGDVPRDDGPRAAGLPGAVPVAADRAGRRAPRSG